MLLEFSMSLCLFLLHSGECQVVYTMTHVSVLLKQATFIRRFTTLGHLLHVLHDEVNDLHTGCEEVLLGLDMPIKGESHGPAVGNLSIPEAARTERS
jgi:hypothetical protein